MEYQYRARADQFRFDRISEEIEQFSIEADLSPKQLFSIQLIVEELTTNIVKYGAKEDPRADIEVTVCSTPDGIELTVSDSTPPFNPLLAKEPDTQQAIEDRVPGGLGLLLVRKCSKALDYRYENGRNIVRAILE